jgi:hypothetical protein
MDITYKKHYHVDPLKKIQIGILTYETVPINKILLNIKPPTFIYNFKYCDTNINWNKNYFVDASNIMNNNSKKGYDV